MLPVSYRCVFKVKILIINIEKSHGTLLYGAHIVDVEKILFDDKIFAITVCIANRDERNGEEGGGGGYVTDRPA